MSDLTETLRDAQRFGFFGGRPIDESIEHSRRFVSAIGELVPGSRILDLGSGGGLPGLVIAEHHRDAEIVLLDRRQKRTDFLERAVRRLGFDHVTVRCADAAAVVAEVASGTLSPFTVVTARGFGPPELTLRTAEAVLADDGVIVISEPPSGDRWPAGLLDELGLTAIVHPSVRTFRRRQAAGD